MVSEEDRKRIVRLWVEDLLSYRQISKEAHLSTGSVSGVINEEKMRQPDLEELRAFNRRLKEGPGYAEALRGANYLREFEKAGFSPGADVLADAVRLMRAHPDDFEGAIEAGRRIIALEKSENKSFKELSDEAESVKGRIQEGNRTLASLEKQTQEMTANLGPLEEYGRLKKELAELGTDVKGMNGFVAFHKRLEALDFDEGSATVLANGLGRRALSPMEGAAEIAEALKKHGTLRSSISDLKEEEKRLREGNKGLVIEEEGLRSRVKAGRTEVEALAKAAEGLKETIAKLETTVASLRDAVTQISKTAPASAREIVDAAMRDLSRAAVRAEKSMDRELSPMAKSVTTSVRAADAAARAIQLDAAKAEKRMKKAANQIVRDMDRVGRQAFDVGREVERLDPISRSYRFIGEGTGDPNLVFPVAMDFMKTFKRWEDGKGLATYDLDGAIEETGKNWNPSETE